MEEEVRKHLKPIFENLIDVRKTRSLDAFAKLYNETRKKVIADTTKFDPKIVMAIFDQMTGEYQKSDLL